MQDSELHAQSILPDEALVPYDGASGITRDYYNAGGQLRWRARLGEWRDAAGKANGDQPYASARIPSVSAVGFVALDVTGLVQEWIGKAAPNHGFYLMGRGSPVFLAARHGADPGSWPRLVLDLADGAEQVLHPSADSLLDETSVYSLGLKDHLQIGDNRRSLVYFDLTGLDGQVRRARLELHLLRAYGPATCLVFRARAPYEYTAGDAELGLAQKYLRDAGIERDADVLLAERCADADFHERWTHFGGATARSQMREGRRPTARNVLAYWVGPDGRFDGVMRREPFRGYAPLPGATGAMECVLSPPYSACLDARFYPTSPHSFPPFNLEHAPEELYFRYYMRFADDWRPRDGGKLPGLGAIEWGTGNGGDVPRGCDGWSARGGFNAAPEQANPMAALVLFRYYIYHMDWRDYGESGQWTQNSGAWMRKGRWYCLEQYCRMNSVTKAGTANPDGVLLGWINGRKVYDRRNLRFRNCARLRVQMVWHNVYHGGTQPPAEPHHVWFCNMVAARRYIGPMRLGY